MFFQKSPSTVVQLSKGSRENEVYRVGPNQRRQIHPLVKKLFLTKFRRTGVALTGHQLIDAARRRKLPAPDLLEALRFIREDVPELAGFAGGRTKPKPSQFQTIGVSKPGVFFVDYGEFEKRWSGYNKGCTGFLLAVENLTNRLFVEATKGKDTNQWLFSIAKFLERTGGVKLVYSDRDSVAKSNKFRTRLEEKYGIKWRFLAKDNKSYLAESLIGYVKRKLGQGLRSRAGSEAKKWVDLLQPICDAYNNQVIPGTKFRRGAVNDVNFDSFVSQLFGDRDPSLSRYNCFKAGPFNNPEWNKAVFKFDVGEKVLLLKSAVWKKEAGAESKGAFAKNSSKGAFTSRTYTIANRQLRANRNFDYMVPVYGLKELGARHLNYYESQMRKVGEWSKQEEREGVARAEAEEREAEAE